MDLFEIDKEFKENIGELILTYSTVEFQIGTLASFIKKGKDSGSIDPNVIGLDLNEKLKIVRTKVKKNQNLLKKWEKLEGNLSTCNDFRRFISHGIVSNHIPNPHLTGLIRAKRNGIIGFRIKKITSKDLADHIKKIMDINTGRNGLGVLIPEIKNWLSD